MCKSVSILFLHTLIPSTRNILMSLLTFYPPVNYDSAEFSEYLNVQALIRPSFSV